MKKIYTSSIFLNFAKFAKFAEFAKNYFARIAALLLMLITMSVGQVWADKKVLGGHLYFDNTLPNQSSLRFCTTQSNYLAFSNNNGEIANTHLVYWNNSTTSSYSSWDLTGWAIVKADGWNNQSGSYGDKTTYMTWYSANVTNYTLNSGSYYLITPSSADKGASLNTSYLSGGYSDLNKKQTVKVMISTNGGASYSEAGQYYGTIKASRYTLTNATTANNSEKTLEYGSNSYASGVITSSITFTASATTSGYTFMGWGESSSATPDGQASKTYTVSGTKTIYAFYKQDNYYVTGLAFTSWGNWTEMTKVSDTNYEITITNIGSEFKLSDKDGYDGEWFTKLEWQDHASTSHTGTPGSNNNLKVSCKTGYTTPVVLHLNPVAKKIWAVATPSAPSTYTVTYNANNATSGSVPTDATKYSSGATVTVKENTGSLARTGYDFAGWNTRADGNGTNYAAGTGQFTISANTTLYAKWTCSAVTISAHPASANYTKDAVAAALSVTAAANGGTLGYQWQESSNNSDWNNVASNGTSQTYTPSAAMAGTKYYRCVVTNTTGDCGTNATSNAATITVSAAPVATGWEIWSASNNTKVGDFVENNGTYTYSHTKTNDNGNTGYYLKYNGVKYTTADQSTISNASTKYALTTSGAASFVFNSLPEATYVLTITQENSTWYINALTAATYTVTYGVVGGNGTLSGPVTSGQTVVGGTNVTFTATPADGYSVEGWYSDESCANSIGTRGNTSLTIENIAADASVYVRFWAPASVSGIAVANVAGDNLVNGETITATPTVSGGKGNKAYCWTLTKGGNTVATEFTWADNKAVSFSVKEAGDYTLTLTVHSEGTCSGLVDGSFAKNFTVYEDEWYVVGNGFWAYNNANNLTPTTKNGDNVSLFFNKDKDGNFYYGPFQFKWVNESYDYRNFRVYNKGKNKQYCASAQNGFYEVTSSMNTQNTGVALLNTMEKQFYLSSGMQSQDYYLYIKDGKMWASTQGPALDVTARLKIVTGETNPRTFYSNEVSFDLNEAQDKTISFYGQPGATYTIERFVLGTGWVSQPCTPSGISANGVYVATLSRSAEGTFTLGAATAYDGTYYIRTSAAAGGWNDYKTYADNVMHKSDFLMTKNGYDYFYVNWVLKNQKINYQIANKYNPAISEEFRDDAITNTTTLPADANIRYMWNSQSNTFDRAYISGSSKISDRFLVLEGDAKLKDEAGNALNISGLRANELNFADKGNWIYQADAKAQPGARAKLTAKYNGQIQYFFGTEETTEQIFGGTGENLYRIRLMYDFKTNRLLSAWLADDSNNPVDEELAIHADVMIVRKHQEPAQQITFESDGKLLDVKTVYGVMQFDKYTLNNRDNDGNILPVENRKSSYERYLYWISFPFDVKLNEVFGFGNYGEHWVLQYYDGAARAANGFWADVDTYWKTVSVEESRDFVMQKNTGYVISLTPLKVYYSSDIFNHTSEVALYFPSAAPVGTIDGELPTAGDFIVPGHQCTITRDDRNIKDSHWNVIGVPGYADVLAQNVPDQQSFVWNGVRMDDVKFIYEWNKVINALEPFANTKDFTFQTMHSYMVQYAGGINWQGGVVPTALAAARRAQADDENKTIKLVLKQGDKDVDRTFVAMDDEATNSFDMNKDMCKVFKSDANIYTMIDYSIEVAGNVIPVPTTQTFIPVGVKIAADGEYTFAMPEGTNGEAVYLIDYDTNITTNLSIMDYTVMLTAGTINDRFALKFVPKGGIVTGMENTDADGNKTVKYLENGQLRILRDGRIFDAQGRVTK